MQTTRPKARHGGVRPGAGRKPAYGEPTRTMRVPESQVSVVASYLAALKNQNTGGTVVSEPGDASAALSLDACRTLQIPRLGRRVKAGVPSTGDDYVEEMVDLGTHLVRDPKATFLMRVSGWSMRDAGICDGDDIVVDRELSADTGRIVVADIDGELTIKRLRCSAGTWLLQAANPDFEDLRVSRKSELHIWGVVTAVLHKI